MKQEIKAQMFTCVLSDATRATSPTESPSKSGRLTTGCVLCRPDGRGCCHLTSPVQKHHTGISAYAHVSHVYVTLKSTRFINKITGTITTKLGGILIVLQCGETSLNVWTRRVV